MDVFLFTITLFLIIKNCTANYNPTSHNRSRFGDETLNYVTSYLGRCNSDEQCEWFGENSGCYEYHCMCKDGYRWYQGSCRSYVGLGQDCTDSLDCYDGYNPLSLTCTDGKCVCSDGYYNRENIDCRKKATKINDFCALDIDCQFDNAICYLGKCRTSKEKLIKNKYIKKKHYKVSYGKTNNCINDADCASIENSVCYNKIGSCVCKKGYFFNSDSSACIGEIGVNVGCKTNSDCQIKPGQCLNGVCYCRDYYFTADGNQNCIKSMSENNWNCLSLEWCYALGPYSYCNSDEKCKCSQIADYNKTNEICVKHRDNPNLCRTDLDCQDALKNGVCIDETCTCKETYRRENDVCMPNIGGDCDDEISCTIDNSHCNQSIGVCECDANYTASETTNNRKCYKISNIGGGCEVEEQCSKFDKYSTCIKNDCSCISNYLEIKGRCGEKTEYMSYCTNRLECTASLGETFYCRNSKCQCNTGDLYVKGICESSGIIHIGNYVLLSLIVLKYVGSILN